MSAAAITNQIQRQVSGFTSIYSSAYVEVYAHFFLHSQTGVSLDQWALASPRFLHPEFLDSELELFGIARPQRRLRLRIGYR